MSFKINEAPNLVLSAITKEKVSRCCGTFWSLACCLPTCGCTICCDDYDEDTISCCYPRAVSTQTKNALTNLKNSLKNEVLLSKVTEDDKKNELTIVESQVKKTLRFLLDTIENKQVGGSYREALEKVCRVIVSRANEAGYEFLDTDPLLNNHKKFHYGNVFSM